jgi:hypothetical protein
MIDLHQFRIRSKFAKNIEILPKKKHFLMYRNTQGCRSLSFYSDPDPALSFPKVLGLDPEVQNITLKNKNFNPL